MLEPLKSQKCVTLLLVLLCGGLVSCHNKAEEDEPVSMPATVSLNGAGATFPQPIYSKWFDEYHKQHPTEVINYQSVGSGRGIGQFLQGNVDFGASDDPLSDEQMSEYRNKYNAMALHFPTVLGADVPSYNLPGVTEELNFTPEALAGIFLGKVTKWNDPEIAKANPNVKLPASDILVVHRLDGSGTTYVWTDYLSKVSEEWNAQVGRGTTVKWPVGMGANGNDGVSDSVKRTTNSLGYVELQFAV
jgi:phosphate transport system substrate-binding protein